MLLLVFLSKEDSVPPIPTLLLLLLLLLLSPPRASVAIAIVGDGIGRLCKDDGMEKRRNIFDEEEGRRRRGDAEDARREVDSSRGWDMIGRMFLGRSTRVVIIVMCLLRELMQRKRDEVN